jgi:NAD-dependent DNA ligase
MYNDLKAKGLEVVAITQLYGYYKTERPLSKDDEFNRLADYIKEWSLPWPIVVSDKSNSENYGVNGIPQYVIVDRAGKVRAIHVGFSPERHEKLRNEVEKVLAEKV